MNNRVSQSVPHLHVHVVPRTKGDGLKGFFWPRTKYRSDEQATVTARAIHAALARGTEARGRRHAAVALDVGGLDAGGLHEVGQRAVERLGQRPHVVEDVGAGQQAEVELVEVAHHGHVEARAVDDRTHREVGEQAGAGRVQRERRARARWRW